MVIVVSGFYISDQFTENIKNCFLDNLSLYTVCAYSAFKDGGKMDLLEQSAVLERIELLAKFACVDDSSFRDRQVALVWIGEMAEDMRKGISCHISSGSKCIHFELFHNNNLA